jgi:hypothetical protein
MYIGLHVQYRYSCQILMKPELAQKIFEKSPNIKFYENPSSGSRVVPRGRTDEQTNGRIEVTKPIDAFRNFVNAPKN